MWLLPGGGVQAGESLVRALRRELWEETGLFPDGVEVPLEGPVAIVDSIAPERGAYRKHVVHVIFAADVTGSLEDVVSQDDAVRGHRAFLMRELDTDGAPSADHSASCSAGSRAIRRSTSARCGSRSRRIRHALGTVRSPRVRISSLRSQRVVGRGAPQESALSASAAPPRPLRSDPKRLRLELVGER